MNIHDYDFEGKKAIVRVDFNVPLDENGKITDTTRIRGAMPTLKYILDNGGALIIMSHMGKPKGQVRARQSLSQIREVVSNRLGRNVLFCSDCARAAADVAALQPGEVLMLKTSASMQRKKAKCQAMQTYQNCKKVRQNTMRL